MSKGSFNDYVLEYMENTVEGDQPLFGHLVAAGKNPREVIAKINGE